jgi:T5SS/PEP-CTERM-associated repeat protein
MNSLSEVRARVFPLLIILLASALLPEVRAEKVWTNVVSGYWQDGTNWTGHTPPDITSFIRITNDNTKIVTIDDSTPATSLTTQMLTLSAPPGATNTLLIKNVGTNNPVTFQTGLELDDGAALRITNSALLLQLTNDHVNIDGIMTLDSGYIDFGDMTVTARVGRVTSGVLAVHGGSVSAGTITVGGLANSTGTVTMDGGQLLVSSLMSIGRNATTVGTFFLLGGQLSVPNDDTRVGDEGSGVMVVSNATASLTNLEVGHDPLSAGTLTLQQGGIIQVQTDVPIGRFGMATGLVQVAGGQLFSRNSTIYVGRGGTGQLTISNGLMQAARVLVCADTTNSLGGSGMMSTFGGIALITSNLSIGSVSYSTGQVAIAGGTVTVTNTQASAVTSVPSGTLDLSGGVLFTDNLQVTNPAGQFVFSGGTLDSKNTQVANGSPFVIGDGSTPATFHLRGGTHSFANGLVISSNATLEGCGTIIGTVINHGIISTNCGGNTVPPATLSFVSRVGSTNTISVQSVTGANYTLEFKDSLSQTNWTQVVPPSAGNGGELLLQDSSAQGAARLYRVLSF